jgi:hypothetical protein
VSDATVIVGVAVALLSTVFATTYGLLPDRIDLSTVFAAYGAGAVVGELLGTLPGRDPRVLGRRWGVTMMSILAAILLFRLLRGLD